MVDISLRISNRLGQILPKPGEILFVSTARCGDNNAIGSRKFVEKWPTARGGVNDCDGPLEWPQPIRQVTARKIRATQIEPGCLSIETAMPNQNHPKRCG